uniref:Si:ch73-193i2.2 n=1 Tax=Poecilia latipinna TaxID=48699 RepID=A0A3B3UQB0_9TELE
MAEPGPTRSIMFRLCLCAQVDLQFLDEVISGGADPNCSDRYGQTVLHEVTPGVQSVEGSGGEDLVPALCVLLSADPSAQTFLDQQTPLHYAAKNDAVRSIKLLLRAGANIGCTDYKQRTPLQLAASMERSEAAQVLLELGANAGVKDSDGQLCISALIGRMSHVVTNAIRQFHVKDRVTRQEYFYLNLLEPEEAGTPGDPSGRRASPSLQVVVLEALSDRLTGATTAGTAGTNTHTHTHTHTWFLSVGLIQVFLPALRNIFDWLVYSLLTASFCAHLADVLQPSVLLHTLSLRLFSISIIFLWLRLMKHVRAFRLMGPFIVMLGNIVGDVMHFLFLYAEIFIPYACSFWIIFGGTPSVPSMQSVSGLLYSLYRITLVDEYEYAAMVTVDNIMAPLLCGTFLAASSILCVNLLIALLSDTFQRVHDNSQANAVMQQAAVILQVEDSMPRLHRFCDNQYISKHCSPLGEACDDLSIMLQVQENHELQVLPIQESQTPQEQKLQGPKKHRNQGQESLERQNQQVQDPKNLQQELQAIQTELKELRSLVQQLLQIRNDFV